MRPASRVWLMVGPVALAAGGGAVALVLTSGHEENRILVSVFGLLVGWAFVVAGLIALTRRPENRTGVLMSVVGLAFFAGALGASNSSILFTLGMVFGAMFIAALIHLMLAYPSGRLGERERQVVIAGYALALLANLLPTLFDPTPGGDPCEGCPENALLIWDSPLADAIVSVILEGLAVVLLAVVVIMLARRWRHSGPAARRLLGPVLIAGGTTLGFFALTLIVYPLSSTAADLVSIGFVIGFVATPFVFLWGILRSRLARSDVGLLLADSADTPTLEETQDAVRDALRDPTAELVYRLDDPPGYFNADRQRVRLEDIAEDRAVTEIAGDDGPIAAIIHDAALLDEPELLSGVGMALRLRLEKDRSVRALRISEYRSRALLDAIPDTMFRLTRDGTFLDIASHDPENVIFPPEQMIGTTLDDIPEDVISRETMDERKRLVRRAFETGEVQTHEYEINAHFGHRFSEARIVPSGENEFVMIVRDVTERKAAEDELQRLHGELQAHAQAIERQRDMLSAMGDATTGLLCVLTTDGTIGFDALNLPLRRLTDHAQYEADGRPFWEVFSAPEDAAEMERVIRATAAGEDTGEQESRWRTKDGRELLVAWTCTRMPAVEDTPRLLISGTDVTERAQHEEQIQRERDYFGALFDAAPSFICVVDHEGSMTTHSLNRSMIDLTGYSDEDVAGNRFAELFSAPEDAARVQATIAAAAAGGDPGEQETYWVTRSGRQVLVAWTCTPLPEREAARRLVISGTDVTERRAREEEQAALRRVAVAVASERRPDDIFQTVTEEVGRLLGADGASMLRYVPDEDEGIILGYWRRADPVQDDTAIGRIVTFTAGPSALVRQTGAPTRLEADGPLPPGLRERFLAQGTASILIAPVLVSGRVWGAVTATRNERSFPTDAEQRVAQFTSLVATALANAETREELLASRARIVEAGDAERRRLERNLHDGAQQRLVSLSLSLRLAQARLRTDADAAHEILSGASAELALALEELRELARGIHPAVLTDRGLGPALESLADRTPLPVTLEQVPQERLPAPVEAAAFYVVSEALANVTKYADASTVNVRIATEDGHAIVEVSDDGVGGADPKAGSGLSGLSDRVAALEGRLAIVSTPGAGTRIRAEIPVDEGG